MEVATQLVHTHQQIPTKLTLNGHCAKFVAIKFVGANSKVAHKAAERAGLAVMRCLMVEKHDYLWGVSEKWTRDSLKVAQMHLVNIIV